MILRLTAFQTPGVNAFTQAGAVVEMGGLAVTEIRVAIDFRTAPANVEFASAVSIKNETIFNFINTNSFTYFGSAILFLEMINSSYQVMAKGLVWFVPLLVI